MSAMRLFLLPISTRRTLIYCERVQDHVGANKPPLQERIIHRASQTWSTWEKAAKGWKKQVTVYGNKLLTRIPYEEWGLKSIPPATKERIGDIDSGKLQFECLYPGAFLGGQNVSRILRTLAMERQALHKKKFWMAIAWMPVAVPFAIVPVIPNLPFFFLVFRAWSHYKALNGSKTLEHLTSHNLIKLVPSSQLDRAYAVTSPQLERKVKGETAVDEEEDEDDEEKDEADEEKDEEAREDEIQHAARKIVEQTRNGQEDVMMLQRWKGKLLAEGFQLPEMAIEIERAVEQVENEIKSR